MFPYFVCDCDRQTNPCVILEISFQNVDILAEKSALIHTQTFQLSLLGVSVPPLGSGSRHGAGSPLAGRHKGASLGSTWSPGAAARSWTNPRCHARRVASAHFTVFWNTNTTTPTLPPSTCRRPGLQLHLCGTEREDSAPGTKQFGRTYINYFQSSSKEPAEPTWMKCIIHFFLRKGVIHSDGFSFLMIRGGKQANDYI